MTDVFVYKFCKRHIPKLNKELFHAAVNVNHVQFIFLLLTASMHIRNVYIDIKIIQSHYLTSLSTLNNAHTLITRN